MALVGAYRGRLTTARRLLPTLFRNQSHRSAEELTEEVQRKAPDVHTWIYRNLDGLENLGVIVHAHRGHGPATYQLASRAHFICEECGRMIEAPDELFRLLARAAQAKLGFTIDPHHFAVLGRCADCQD